MHSTDLSSPLEEYAQKRIALRMRRDKIPGVSIAIVEDQSTVWHRSFGYSNVEEESHTKGRTLYRIGSISKIFTVLAALQLVDKNELQLDTPVRKWLPKFNPRSVTGSQEITPRMLMTHHSGLPRDVLKSLKNQKEQSVRKPNNEFVGFLTHNPNSLFSYSNLGMAVLGELVEEITRTPFVQRITENIFSPMHMIDSSFSHRPTTSELLAKSYDGKKSLPMANYRDISAGGMTSNVPDLCRFMKMIFADGESSRTKIISSETLSEMLRVQNSHVAMDFDMKIGLGFFLAIPDKSQVRGGGMYAWHGGAIDGYRSFLGVLPGTRLGAVVLANSSTGRNFAAELASELLQFCLNVKKQTLSIPSEVSKPAIGNSSTIHTDITKWPGTYTTEFGCIRIYSKDGKTLWISAYGKNIKLRETGRGEFGLDYKMLGVIPINIGYLGNLKLLRRVVEKRELLTAIVEGSREVLFGERLDNQARDAKLQMFAISILGLYRVTNWDDDDALFKYVEISKEDNFLVAKIPILELNRSIKLVLKLLNQDQALLHIPLADGGEMIEITVSENSRVNLTISGLILEKISPRLYGWRQFREVTNSTYERNKMRLMHWIGISKDQ
jgi:CubicO group peptidase (beta-lactamase class C family)